MDFLPETLGMRQHPSQAGWCSVMGEEGWMRWHPDITSHPTLPRSDFTLFWGFSEVRKSETANLP